MNNVRNWWRRRAVELALLVLFALIAVAGIGFIAIGGYVAVQAATDPWSAGLLVGGVLLGLGIIAAAVTWLVARRYDRNHDRKRETQPPQTAEEIPLQTITGIGQALGERLLERGLVKSDILLAALVAGAVLGASPALRRRFRGNCRRRGDNPSRE